MTDLDNRNNDDLSYYYGTENPQDNCYIDAYAEEKTSAATDRAKVNGPFSYVISVFFLIWFFGSIGAMIFLSNNGSTDLCLAVFGQLFLIFGIIGTISMIKSKSFQAFVLLFPLIGAGCLFFSLTYHFMPETREDMMNMIPYLMLALFFVIGLGIFIYGILGPVMLRKKCTQTIMGKVIKLQERYNDGSKTYCPTFEIYYRSEMKEICNKIYTNYYVPQVGESVELCINPDNPDQFYIPSQNKSMGGFLIIFGLVFMAVPVISFFAMMSQQ